MPFGTVLTLPATGSEMNSGAVITRKETKEKLGMDGSGLFPQFSVLDPQVVHSIPQRQLANGLTDAFTHVLEQYLTFPDGAYLQDRFSESNWAIHGMGHELTALYGIDHARTLAIIAPSHYTFNFETKKEKLVQYAERVWNITEGSTEEKAKAAISRTEAFFHELGIDTKLSQYIDAFEGTAEEVSKRFRARGWEGIGEHKNLTPADVEVIVKMAY